MAASCWIGINYQDSSIYPPLPVARRILVDSYWRTISDSSCSWYLGPAVYYQKRNSMECTITSVQLDSTYSKKSTAYSLISYMS